MRLFAKQTEKETLDETRTLERCVGTVFIDGLQRASREPNANKSSKLGNPDPLISKIWRNGTLDGFHQVFTDTAFFLRETATVNSSAGTDFCASDTADLSHDFLKNFSDARAVEIHRESKGSRKFLKTFGLVSLFASEPAELFTTHERRG
jgi:hypothetical protein